jgi:hypothetical protein
MGCGQANLALPLTSYIPHHTLFKGVSMEWFVASCVVQSTDGLTAKQLVLLSKEPSFAIVKAIFATPKQLVLLYEMISLPL